jgi:hypothetical protein
MITFQVFFLGSQPASRDAQEAAFHVHALLLREERSYPGKKGWPTIVLLSMYVLYFSERRETIQVKKDWTIVFLLSNWSILCYLERREIIQVKKGWPILFLLSN